MFYNSWILASNMAPSELTKNCLGHMPKTFLVSRFGSTLCGPLHLHINVFCADTICALLLGHWLLHYVLLLKHIIVGLIVMGSHTLAVEFL